MERRVPFVKGHGTQNDFVLLPDPDGVLLPDLDAATVRRLTDRHTGLAADGVIRVVRSAALDGDADLLADAEWQSPDGCNNSELPVLYAGPQRSGQRY